MTNKEENKRQFRRETAAKILAALIVSPTTWSVNDQSAKTANDFIDLAIRITDGFFEKIDKNGKY